MQEWYKTVDALTNGYFDEIVKCIIILVVGIPAMNIVLNRINKFRPKKLDKKYIPLINRTLRFIGVFIIVMLVAQQFGLKLTPLFGAAGVVGIAIGFAAKTVLGNLLSGYLLMAEAPFTEGEVIDADGKIGIVEDIALLSVKVRTFDGKLVRMPSERLVANTFTNNTRNKVRRLDLEVFLKKNADTQKAINLFTKISTSTENGLSDPNPLVLFKNFNEFSQSFLVGVWYHEDNFVALKNELSATISKRFQAEGFEIGGTTLLNDQP